MAFWRSVEGLPAFEGLKVTGSARAAEQFPDLALVNIERNSDLVRFDRWASIGDGGNSGFQAMNLAFHFGAARVALVGFDMTAAAGVHWHGKHPRGLNNPRASNFVRWRRAFDASADVLDSAGLDVFNTSAQSAIDCFPKVPLEDLLK